MKKLIIPALLCIAYCKVNAQNFQLVKDINSATNSTPYAFSAINGIIYFSADDGIHGNELWRSDGTGLGTYLIADINIGLEGANPSGMTEYKEIIYFRAYTEEYGYELWRSDGTASGTYMVKDIYPGVESGAISYSDNNTIWLTVVNNILFFTAISPGADGELWRTDGTEAGTHIVKDINIQGRAQPTQLVNYNGILYFFAIGNNYKDSLYRSDGTANGTVGVQRIDRSFIDAPTDYEGIIVMKNVMYFSSGDNKTYRNNELWRSDGTTAGTHLMKEINPDDGAYPTRFIVLDSILYFQANDGLHGNELWKSDGTVSGTYMVHDTYKNRSYYTNITDIVIFNGLLYYNYEVAGIDIKAEGLWKTDGTDAGTIKAMDFTGYDLVSTPSSLLFLKKDSIYGNELWKSNGTNAGTQIVKDIQPGSYNGIANYSLFAEGNFVYFDGSTFSSGIELWKSNGFAEQTVMVKDINTSVSQGSGISFLPSYGSKLFFTAYNNIYGQEPYLSDGTDSGTYLLKEINPGNEWNTEIVNVVNLNDTLFFQEINYEHDPGTLYNQWQSNGNADNTVLKANTVLNSGNFTAGKNNLFFSYADPATGNELWRSNGFKKNTFLIKDINPGALGSSPSFFTIMDDILYFSANDSRHGQELWRSNGTSKGTYLVTDLYAGFNSASPSSIYAYQHHLFFYTQYNNSIWLSDGTAAGTMQLLDSATGEALKNLQGTFTGVGEFVYFSAYTSATGNELWKADAKSNKAVLVKNITSGSLSSGLENLTNVNGQLFFTVSKSLNYPGNHLWHSDGTAAGTYWVKDIFPGKQYFKILSLVNANGILAFLAKDDYYSYTSPYNLWFSNGTDSGTYQSKDTVFKDLKIISSLIAINNRLYFVAQNYTYGDELWSGIVETNSSPENMYAKYKTIRTVNATVSPNPFSNNLSVYFASPLKQDIYLSITDVNGKVLQLQKKKVDAGQNQIIVNTALKPGAYFLKIDSKIKSETIKIIHQ